MCLLLLIHYITTSDTPPSSLMDLIASPKVTTTEGKGVGVRTLVHSTLGVEGRVGALRWGLGILANKSITHKDLHKPNNNWLVRSWNIFGARTSHG
jgi:hypothetical protein